MKIFYFFVFLWLISAASYGQSGKVYQVSINASDWKGILTVETSDKKTHIYNYDYDYPSQSSNYVNYLSELPTKAIITITGIRDPWCLFSPSFSSVIKLNAGKYYKSDVISYCNGIQIESRFSVTEVDRTGVLLTGATNGKVCGNQSINLQRPNYVQGGTGIRWQIATNPKFTDAVNLPSYTSSSITNFTAGNIPASFPKKYGVPYYFKVITAGSDLAEEVTINSTTFYPEVPTPAIQTTSAACNGESGSILMNNFKIADGSLYNFNNGPVHLTLKEVNNRFPEIQHPITSHNYQHNNLPPGTWTIQLRTDDNAACYKDLSPITIQDPPPPVSFTAVSVSPSCYNGAGKITVSGVSGGNGNYLYALDGGAFVSTSTFSAIPGSHTITVKDSKGCASSQTVTINNTSAVVLAYSKQNNPTGYGRSDGEIIVTASGGSGYYTYFINGSPHNLQNLAAGTYSVSVKDNNSCSSNSISVTLTQPAPLSINQAAKKNPSCHGETNGSLTVAVSGGTAPYSYVINGVRTPFNIFNNLAGGNYHVAVFDKYNNEASFSAQIIDPDYVKAKISKTNAACIGGEGSIQISSPVGGTGSGYRYSVDGVSYQISPLFTVPAGDYSVWIEDSNGCVSAPYAVTIAQPSSKLIASASSIPALCFGAANGSVKISASGGGGNYRYSKDNWATSTAENTFSGLKAGSYTFQVRDQNTCTIEVTATIKQPKELQIVVDSVDHVYCYGETGSIHLSSAGGTGVVSYSAEPFLEFSAGAFIKAPAGDYILTATDENGCKAIKTVTITSPALITANPLIQPVSCYGNTDGQIVLNANGGTGTYQYTLLDQPSPQLPTHIDKFTGLKAGKYSFSIQDARGCIVYTEVEVKQPQPLNIELVSQKNVSCFGGSDGSLEVRATGGNGDYRFELNTEDNGNSPLFDGLKKGFYTAKVTDAKGCQAEIQVKIDEPEQLILVVNPADVICKDENTGTIAIEVQGGTAPFGYSINTGAQNTSGLFTGLYAGEYSITVTDANGCTASAQAVIHEPPIGISATFAILHESCNGKKDGAVTVTGFVGEGMTFALRSSGQTSPFQADPLFPNLQPGNYELIIKNNLDCQKAYPVVISTNQQLVLTESSNQGTTCFGAANGELTVGATGGTGVYQYRLNDGLYQQSPAFKNLQAGEYIVTVRDSRGCIAIVSSRVAQPGRLTIICKAQKNVSCFGGADGQIVVSAIGGTAPFTYAINGGAFQADSIFTNLPAGEYNIAIADRYGCDPASILTIYITMPAERLSAKTFSVQSVSCFGSADGQVLVQTRGGTSPYRYAADNGNFSTGSILNHLTAGKHLITVKDRNDCTFSFETNIPSPAPLTLICTKTDITCNGSATGSISLMAFGGNGRYRYSKDGVRFQSSNRFEGLPAGLHIFTVEDWKNCRHSISVDLVHLFEAIAFTLDADPPAGCDDKGSITIRDVKGGKAPYLFSINGETYSGQTFYNGLPPGEYTLFVKDANGCIVSKRIAPYGPLSITADYETTNVSCTGNYDGRISVTNTRGGTGTYEYSVNGSTFQPEPVFNALKPGLYQLAIRDKPFSCQSILTIEIKEPEPLSVLILSSTAISCKGAADGRIMAKAAGGTAPYKWSVNGTDFQTGGLFTGLEEKQYMVYVTDARGCTASAGVTIDSPEALTLGVSETTQVFCHGGASGAVSLNAGGGTGPYRYKAGNGTYQDEPVFTGLKAGKHTFTVSDKNNCTASTEAELTEPSALQLAIAATHNTCHGAAGGEATLAASGGSFPYRYSKDGGISYSANPFFTGLKSGKYSFAVKDANGCIVVSEKEITEPGQISIAAVVKHVTCYSDASGSIDAAVAGNSGQYQYALNDGPFQSSGFFTGLACGMYQVTARNENGCTGIARFAVLQNDSLTSRIRVLKQITCSGARDGEVYIDAAGGQAPYQFSLDGKTWQPADHFNRLSEGKYQIYIKDTNGCTTSIDAEITDPEVLNFTLKEKQDSRCYGGNGWVKVQATGGKAPYLYSINSSGFKSLGEFDNLKPGRYTFTVRDARGCTQTAFAEIAQPTQLTISLVSAIHPSCYQAADGKITVHASGGSGAYQYRINASQASKTGEFNLLGGGLYEIEATDEAGCTARLQASLTGPLPLRIEKQLVLPKCTGQSTGEIALSVSGGTAPYTYNWLSNPAFGNTDKLTALGKGIYQVMVEDAMGCTLQERIELKEPPPVLIETVHDTVLCKGQQIILRAGNQGCTYNWTADNGFNSSGEAATISEAGNYQLTVTNPAGCAFSKKFKVSTSSSLLKADFLLSTYAAAGDTVIVVDISKPTPSKTTWQLPAGATLAGANSTGTIQQLVFQKPGTYQVALSAAVGECADAVSKTITVLEKDQKKEVNNALGYREKLTVDLKVSPNPTTGYFKAGISASEKTDVRLRLIDFATNRLIDTAEGRQQQEYTFEFDRPDLQPGIYLIVIEAGGQVKTVKLIKV